MKLNKIVPVSINPKNMAEQAQNIIDPVLHKLDVAEIIPKVSPARVHLEMNAELMSPEEYIAARSYIAELEISELIASEMRTLK